MRVSHADETIPVTYKLNRMRVSHADETIPVTYQLNRMHVSHADETIPVTYQLNRMRVSHADETIPVTYQLNRMHVSHADETIPVTYQLNRMRVSHADQTIPVTYKLNRMRVSHADETILTGPLKGQPLRRAVNQVTIFPKASGLLERYSSYLNDPKIRLSNEKEDIEEQDNHMQTSLLTTTNMIGFLCMQVTSSCRCSRSLRVARMCCQALRRASGPPKTCQNPEKLLFDSTLRSCDKFSKEN